MARYRACVVLAAAIGCTPNTAPEPDASKQDAAKVEGLAKQERPAQGEAPVGDPEPKKGEAPADVEAPKPTADAEPEAHTPEPDGDEAPEVQKAEPNDGATIVPASEVPVSKVQVEPAVVTWRTVTTVDAPVAFEPISRGVLGRDSSTHKFYDVDENGAFVQRDIEAPDGPILGTWPKNAWYVEIREKEITGDRSGEVERTLRLMRLRGKKRWVPQRFDGEQRFEDQGERFIASAKSGLLVVEWGGEDITRITDNAVPDPELGVTKNGPLVGVFETRKGTLYSARVSGDRVYVQRNCSEDEYMCVTINAAPLPEDTMWKFRGAVARAKYSVSAIAEHGNQETPHLLH